MINQNRLQLPKIQYLLGQRRMPAFYPSRYWDNPYETSPLHLEMTQSTRRSSQSCVKVRVKGKDRQASQQKEEKVLAMTIRKFGQEKRKCPSPSPTNFVQIDKENQQEIFVKRARQLLNRKNVHSRMTDYSEKLNRQQAQSILSQKVAQREEPLSGWNNTEEEFLMMI